MNARYTHCEVEECQGNPKTGGHGYCNKHYLRWTRYGSAHIQRHATAGSGYITRGYKTLRNAEHPLAQKSGRILEHRMVLFDAIGDGPHPCHWCGTLLNWGKHNRAIGLTVDHLNWDTLDNRLENLVPSCNPCNAKRRYTQTATATKSFPQPPTDTQGLAFSLSLTLLPIGIAI